MARTGERIDPYGVFHFKIDIDGVTVASFSECSGLEMQVKYDEVREGGNNEFVHRLPGRLEYGNLALKRGYAESNEFFKWCLTALNRQGRALKRRDVTVTLVNTNDRSSIFSWTFVDAYPVKWSGPSFRSGESSIAIESLELAHRGLQIS
ncbi:MAG: phage tail protein [Chloroflexi bacterium]|nr:phage tail protein [Chloroflexota bacterium]